MQCSGRGEQSDPQQSPKETINLLFSPVSAALLSPCMGGKGEDPAANFGPGTLHPSLPLLFLATSETTTNRAPDSPFQPTQARFMTSRCFTDLSKFSQEQQAQFSPGSRQISMITSLDATRQTNAFAANGISPTELHSYKGHAPFRRYS